jgi:DNA-binding FadR family transcriptional regulator
VDVASVEEPLRASKAAQPTATVILRSSSVSRKDVREFIRRLEAAGLTVESRPGHYHVLRDGKPLRKVNGLPFTLPFSPDTTRWRRAAIVDLRKLDIHV